MPSVTSSSSSSHTPVPAKRSLLPKLVATLALISIAVALPAVDESGQLVKRAGTVISTGTNGLVSGKINNQLSYQASGVLISGGCNPHINIKTCWQMSMNQTGNLQRRADGTSSEVHAYDPANAEWEVDDDARDTFDFHEHEYTNEKDLEKRATTQRQRTEIYSLPPAPAGSRNLYIWSSYLTVPPSTVVGTNFFHLFQLLRRDGDGGAVLYGDVKRDTFFRYDTVRAKNVTIPLSSVQGRVVQHRLSVIAGPRGALNYTMIDLDHNKRLITYSATGDTGTNTSVKFGLYRTLPVPGPASGYYGDYQVRTF